MICSVDQLVLMEVPLIPNNILHRGYREALVAQIFVGKERFLSGRRKYDQ